jgi:hypothetical protein
LKSRAQNEKWVPRSCVLCKGGNDAAGIISLFAFHSLGGDLRHTIPKRNLSPPLIDPDWSAFTETIKSVTAPTPLLGRLHQSALHRVAMHVSQFLPALLGSPVPRKGNRR